MIKITKVYTRKGDSGKTSLAGGFRVSKDDHQVETYGTLDELQAVLGVVRAELASTEKNRTLCESLQEDIQKIQNWIFDLGSVLAKPLDGSDTATSNNTWASPVDWMEIKMDGWNKGLGDLNSFILSGGGKISSQVHVARTVCRRAERILITLCSQKEMGEGPMSFLNRLSDFLFVLGRLVTKEFQEPEILWETPLMKKKDNPES